MRSMTGFGKASGKIGQNSYQAEIRSLNSKQLNLKVQLPHRFHDKEIELRSYFAKQIPRGKVDVSIREVSGQEEKLYSINEEVLRSHYKELQKLAEDLNDDRSDILATAMQIPDSISYGSAEAEAYEVEALWKLLEEAAKAFDDFTAKEGKNMREDIEESMNAIKQGVEQIEGLESERREQVKERIWKKIQEDMSPEELDEKRFEQELLHYLERLDINEEKTRLKSHLEQLHEVMDETEPGKKLHFVSQEMGREINTIGSKADHAMIQREVVNMKEHLEQIKEQLMNVR